MIASMRLLFFIAISLLAASPSANAAEERSVSSLILQLQSPSAQERTRASQYIHGAGISDIDLYNAVAEAVSIHRVDLNADSPGSLQQEIAWHAKALGGSAIYDYMPLLEELSESPAKTVAKHAKKSKDQLRETAARGAPYLDAGKVSLITDSQRANCEFVEQASCKTLRSYDNCVNWHKERAAQKGANAIMVLRESGIIRSSSMANYFRCSHDDLASPELIAVNLNTPVVLQEQEPNVPSYILELEALAKLLDDGIITEQEFQSKKSQILSGD